MATRTVVVDRWDRELSTFRDIEEISVGEGEILEREKIASLSRSHYDGPLSDAMVYIVSSTYKARHKGQNPVERIAKLLAHPLASA